MNEPSREVYQKEYFYLATLQRQAKDFSELMSRFSEDDLEVKKALREANSVAAAHDPRRILDPDELRRTREEYPEVFGRIAPVYERFLKEKAGLV